MAHSAETDALKAVRDFLTIDRASLAAFGAAPPRALLLSGPPGIGKTKSVQIASSELKYPVIAVTPGRNVQEQLRQAFNPTPISSSQTRVVFLDEVDAICPSRTSANKGQSTRTTALLLSYLDPPPLRRKKKEVGHIFVIAATNRPNAIDPGLRRPGRFGREVTLMPPTAVDRYRLLTAIEPTADPDTLREIADRASGFVAADLVSMCKRARQLSSATQMNAAAETNVLTAVDLRNAFAKSKPSILRDSLCVEMPTCGWESIGGLADVKRRMQMAVEWPLRYAETFKRLQLKAPRGIMLHGPPGCSKTTMVRVAASQSGAAFLRLSGADVYSCYLGEAERILREAFSAARAAAPCILFLDEIDAIVGKRGGSSDGNGVQERVLSTLLTEMDGVVSVEGVLVIGATNRVDMLDEALMRPGRFDDVLEVALPDEVGRLEILRIHCKDVPIGEDVDLAMIAKETEGSSGADLKGFVTQAGLMALRELYSEGCGPNIVYSGDMDNGSLKVMARHFASVMYIAGV